jgi:general secretion pathway protein H
MLQTSANSKIAGFTLIEMMAVMLIVALMAAIVFASIPGTGRAELKAKTMAAAALLRRERLSAILTRSDRRVSLDGGRRLLIGDGGDEVSIPSDVIVDVLAADNAGGEASPTILFRPDGASSGGALRFSREAAGYEIHVNWYTGTVYVQAE